MHNPIKAATVRRSGNHFIVEIDPDAVEILDLRQTAYYTPKREIAQLWAIQLQNDLDAAFDDAHAE